MDPDGLRLTNLTRGQKQKGRDSDPQWSPDGTRLAFVSDRDGTNDIWLMNTDGSGAKNLTRGAGDDLSPRWSPDGRRIAFTSSRDGDVEIYLMNADGAEQTNLTKADGDDLQPAWSPDGTQIAFVSERGKKGRSLYALKVDAPRTPAKLAAPPCDVGAPAWSPDGAQVAFVSCVGADGKGAVDATQHAVYVVPAAGGDLTAISDTKGESGGPTYRRDGGALAFWSYRGQDQADIVIVSGGMRRVVQGPPGIARDPAWAADSGLLAFISGDFTAGQLVVADASGVTHPITSNGASNRTPHWSLQKLP